VSPGLIQQKPKRPTFDAALTDRRIVFRSLPPQAPRGAPFLGDRLNPLVRIEQPVRIGILRRDDDGFDVNGEVAFDIQES
jgi:hypothetical protein